MRRSKLQKWRLHALVIAWLARDTIRPPLKPSGRAMGKSVDPFSDYFDRCRRKRNVIDYDDAHVATETEAKEILAKATEFAEMVEQWIAKTHPSLKT
jgi:hypothetical protein